MAKVGRKDIPLGTPVAVDWWDAHTPEAGWSSINKKDFKPERVRSLGFLLNYDTTALTLAGDANPTKPLKDDVNRVLTIPAGMVDRVQPLPMEA